MVVCITDNINLVNLVEIIMSKTHKLSILAAIFGFLFCQAATAAVDSQATRALSGVIAAANGPVTISYINDDGASIGRVAEIGDDIYLNDEITTGPDMSLQILLRDQTVFSIGPNSSLIFDEFIYDPAAVDAASLSASVTKGSFKFISGKISKLKPGAMQLKLPNATASIRGTSVAGRVAEDGGADIVLLTGAIALQSDAAPAVDIFQSGWGVTVDASGGVSPPVPFSADEINALIDEATISPNDNGDGEGAAPTLASAPSATTIEEGEALLLAAIDPEADDVSASTIVATILSNETLLAQLAENEVAIEILQDSLESNVVLDTDLISYILSGGSPLWLFYDGNGNLQNPVPNLPQYQNDLAIYNEGYAGLVSTSYSGSVNFTKSDLALAPSAVTNGDTGSGTASFDITLNYDTAAVTGSFSTSDIIINNVNYGAVDTANSGTTISNTFVPGSPSLLDGVPLLTGGSLANGAQVEFVGSFGSITNGTTTEDGTLGGFEVNVNRAGTTDPSLKGEVYQIGTVQ